MERHERQIILSGDRLQDDRGAESIRKMLNRVAGLTTKEVVERVIYFGLPELKFFEESQPQYGPHLAEGSMWAIVEDLGDHSPSREIRQLTDEGKAGLTGIHLAFNDIERIANEGRLEQIQGIGPRRRHFLEHFISAAKGEDYFADLRQPMA